MHQRWLASRLSISKIFYFLLLSNVIIIFSISLSLFRRKGRPNLAKSTYRPNEFALDILAGHQYKVGNVTPVIQRLNSSDDAVAATVFIPNNLDTKWTNLFPQSLSRISTINDHSEGGDSGVSDQHPRVDGAFGVHSGSGRSVRPMVVVACIREPPTRNATVDQVDWRKGRCTVRVTGGGKGGRGGEMSKRSTTTPPAESAFITEPKCG
jgi:hypothetical protein